MQACYLWARLIKQVCVQKVVSRALRATTVKRRRISSRPLSRVARRDKTLPAQNGNCAVEAEILVTEPETKPTGLLHVETEKVAFLGSSQTRVVFADQVHARLLLLCCQAQPPTEDPTQRRVAQRHGKNQFALWALVGVSHTHGSFVGSPYQANVASLSPQEPKQQRN